MTGLGALWLPILLSAVFVFIASSLIHMVLPWHKGDYPALPDQDRILEALRGFSVPPGDYFLPRPANREDMRSAAHVEKMKKGPVLMMTVMPNGVGSMARNLGQWFVFCLVVSLLAAAVAGAVLPIGADNEYIFRVVGLTSFMGYTLALWPMSIWYRRSWALTLKATVDGLIYGVITAGTFGWLWPR